MPKANLPLRTQTVPVTILSPERPCVPRISPKCANLQSEPGQQHGPARLPQSPHRQRREDAQRCGSLLRASPGDGGACSTELPPPAQLRASLGGSRELGWLNAGGRELLAAFAFSSWPLALSQEEPASTSRCTSSSRECQQRGSQMRPGEEGRDVGRRSKPGTSRRNKREKTGEPGEMQTRARSSPRWDSSQGCGARAGAAGMPRSLPKGREPQGPCGKAKAPSRTPGARTPAGAAGGDAGRTRTPSGRDLLKISRLLVKKREGRGEKNEKQRERKGGGEEGRGREGAWRHGRDFLIGTP